jgi:hypothetical protein
MHGRYSILQKSGFITLVYYGDREKPWAVCCGFNDPGWCKVFFKTRAEAEEQFYKDTHLTGKYTQPTIQQQKGQAEP